MTTIRATTTIAIVPGGSAGAASGDSIAVTASGPKPATAKPSANDVSCVISVES